MLCHCSNCQRAGGGLGSMDCMLSDDNVVIINDKSPIPKYEDMDMKSKGAVERHVCSRYGSPIYYKAPKNNLRMTIIKLSLFAEELNELLCP
ncbi:unnamed protein product [Adineta ricciae]|uniref:CENP-V/GFA domain-containing protein n=1 Tax=Adineta ricciae TaxID=249248 RepID=A0A814V5U2_ADIRI|nr:unnamed protein product [Adineta ricciae]CAF1382041.1 unnamed protein product [Adineta ricciae]